MKLKTFLKNNSQFFHYGDLVIYERGFYALPDNMLGYVDLKEVYRGLIFKVVKCGVQMMFVNANKLYDKKEAKTIKKYLNREVVGINMKTGDNKKYNINGHPFTERIVEVVIFNELSVL